MMARACVVVVETRPENVRHNPRQHGLSAGVDDNGGVYVRCNAVVLGSGCLVTTSKAAEWLVDARLANWHAGTTDLVFETVVPLGGRGGRSPCFGLLVLRPKGEAKDFGTLCEAATTRRPTAGAEGRATGCLLVCGAPFGCSELAGCCFPVVCDAVFPFFGVTRLAPMPLCEGMDGAPVVRAVDGLLCGVLLCAQTGAAWLPFNHQHTSLAHSLLPKPVTCDCVVGLLGERAWASGIVLSTSEDGSAVVVTCAHFVAQCSAIQVWQHGKQVGTVTQARTPQHPSGATLDVAVITVACYATSCNHLSSARCREKAVAAGTPVATVGFHSTPPNRTTSSSVPQQRCGLAVRPSKAASEWLVTTCDAGCGSSGGAVVDSTGAVIGMQCRSYDGRSGTSLSLACPITAVLDLVSGAP